MKDGENTLLSYILPCITVIAALIYGCVFNDKGNPWTMVPAASGIICSLSGMFLIKKFDLNIEKNWRIYLISIISGMFIAIHLFYYFSNTILLAFISFGILLIAEYIILNIKVRSFMEKFVLIIINPVIHFFILCICVIIHLCSVSY